MAAIFEPVTIGWDGKEYTITPTMRLLNQIEQHISIAKMGHSLAINEPRISHVATATAILLQSAGVSVTDEEVYQRLMYAGQEEVAMIAAAIVTAAFPNSPEAKRGNDKAPSKSAKRQK